MIYAGGWPYNPDKDEIEDPGWSEDGAKKGAALPRFAMMDQWGDTVDIYDFANQGKPILFDISTMWCPPCNDLAAWLDYDPEVNLGETYEPIREAVENGDIYWITALSEDKQYNPPDLEDLEKWYGWYPTEEILILADNEPNESGYTNLMLWADLMYFPSVMFINEDMVVEKYKFDNWTKALDEALEYLEESSD
jgi:thiol-disulfide isomerase/thioredoxin